MMHTGLLMGVIYQYRWTAMALAWVMLLSACDRDASLSEDGKTRGVLLEVSPLPDPVEAPYADCLQVVRLQVTHSPEAKKVGEEVLVAWPGFQKRTLTAMAALEVGDAVATKLVPFLEAPPEVKSQQRADWIEALDLEFFYAETALKVKADDTSATPSGTASGAHKPMKAFDVAVPRRESRRDAEARRVVIESEVERIEQALQANGGDWEKWSANLQPFYKDLWSKEMKAGGSLRVGRHVYERTYNHRFGEMMSEASEPPALRLLVALDRELAERGIDLIVAPFPFKEEINGGLFGELEPADGYYAPNRLRMIHWLLTHDVEVLDLAPPLKRNLEQEWLFYDYSELHPARDGVAVAAQAIARRLERYELKPTLSGLQKQDLTFRMPDSFRERFPDMPTLAEYPATQIYDAEGRFLPRTVGSSPVLLIGDSFTRVPMLYGVQEASLREHLAFETRVLPKSVRVKGSASQIMRILNREREDLLEDVEVCVFVFAQYPLFSTASKSGQSTWQIVPLER